MKTYIYFVRHGEINNPSQIWYGRLPRFSLSPLGQSQMEQTAQYLSDKHIDVIYASPLLRAKQSALIIKNKLKLPAIHFSKNLLEVQSSLQGKQFSLLRQLKFNIFASPQKGVVGETIENLLDRMQTMMARLANKHQGQHVVVVTHGDPIMVVKAKINGWPLTNASIHPPGKKYIQHGEVYLVEAV